MININEKTDLKSKLLGINYNSKPTTTNKFLKINKIIIQLIQKLILLLELDDEEEDEYIPTFFF